MSNQRSVEVLYPHWRPVTEEHRIALVRNRAALEAAAKAHTRFVNLLSGNSLNIDDMIGLMRDSGKLPPMNLGLPTGLSRKAVNAEFLAARAAAGIVSTHSDILRGASKHGLITVQRTLLWN